MSWVKLDDQFPDHPKVVAAGGDAAWLYVAGLCYCQAKMTDGRIPSAVVPRLTDRKAPAQLAAKLVAVKLWEVDGQDYLIHDYHEFNDAAETLKARKEAARKRVSEWRAKRSGNGVCNALQGEYVTPHVLESNNESNTIRTPTPARVRTASATATTKINTNSLSATAVAAQPNLIANSAAGNGKRETWLTPYVNAWVEIMGGQPAAGELARYADQVRKLLGEQKSIASLRAYLRTMAADKPEMAAPAVWARSAGTWLPAETQKGEVLYAGGMRIRPGQV